MFKTLGLISLLLLAACSSNENEAAQNESIKAHRIDTLSPGQYNFDLTSSNMEMIVYRPNTENYSQFFNGDTVYLTLRYEGPHQFLNEHHSVGLRAVSKNIRAERISADTYEIIIDKNNEQTLFSYEPFVSSDRVVFEGSHYDTIQGFTELEYTNVMSPFLKTFPITLKD